jgi:hypothetical protein
LCEFGASAGYQIPSARALWIPDYPCQAQGIGKHPAPIASHPNCGSKGPCAISQSSKELEDIMRILGVIGTAVLFLLLVTTAPVFAQDETKPDEAKSAHKQDEKAKPEDKAKHEDKAAKPDETKGDREQPGARQDEHRGQPEARPQTEQRPEGSMGRDQQHRAHAQGSGKHIPDDKFRASFGRQHTFKVNRVINQTTIVPGQTQFVTGGFTFVVLDPWPSEFLVTDDCFIDFIDGDYFLVDVFHPEVRVALLVVG